MKSYIKKTNSKDQIRVYSWNKTQATVYPDFSFQTVLDMVDSDPVARGAITHFVDKCMEGDRAIIKRDTQTYDSEEELVLDSKYNFRTEIERKAFLMGKLFNNVFIEIVRDVDGKTKALNILDSLNIEPITDTNGDPVSFKSKTPNAKTGQYAKWDKKDIVWVKIGDRTTGFAPVDMKALFETLLMKEYIKRYVAWLWKTGQYRLIYGFKNSSDKDVEDAIAFMKKADNNFQVPIIAKGELETKILRDMKETDSLVELLKYLDGQTLILLRIPPIDAGIPDASGRSNADAQSNNFIAHVTSIKKLMEDAYNFDLFPKINKGNTMLRYAPVDRFSEKQVLEIVQIMQSANMKDEVIREFMQDRGMFFKEVELFKAPEEMGSAMKNPRALDTMPSRTGKGAGEGNKPKAQVSTRQDQIKKV